MTVVRLSVSTYCFLAVAAPLLGLRPEYVIALLLMLVVRKHLLPLVHKLDRLHRADLGVANRAHVENLAICLKVLQKIGKVERR